MQHLVSITGLSCVSALGSHKTHIWEQYTNTDSYLRRHYFSDTLQWVGKIPESEQVQIALLAQEDKYKALDLSVLQAIYVSRKAIKQAGWQKGAHFGVNIGSSRGATALFEKYHQEFLQTGKAPTLSSPTTTLGNISSWVGQDVKSKGPEISHSITCSTGLHALLNGVVWLQSGMADKFMVGASEACLTPFTIAQMQALKIYAPNTNAVYPCKALDLAKTKNTMALGEGAGVICIEKGIAKNALALISGIGYATEMLQHSISVSSDALCFQEAMKMALKDTCLDQVDAIVMHAPGTIKGDLSEYKAIEKVFGSQHMPALTTNKWKIGHTFGASGVLSLELAVLMLESQEFIPAPLFFKGKAPKKIENILVNAVGFGGNAISVLLSKADTHPQKKSI